MDNTIADKLKERVKRHYSESSDPLLLSDFGKELRDAGIWPIEGERRTLASIIEGLSPDLRLIRDPDAKAFVVVVPAGKESLAEQVLKRRRDATTLKKLPRAVLFAFCADTDKPVYLRTVPPYKYSIDGPLPDAHYKLVDSEFRLPGVFINESRQLSGDVAERLTSLLKSWAYRHQVNIDQMTRPVAPPAPQLPSHKSAATSALERLYQAQSEDWRDRLVVPVDIALTLSRLP